MDDQTLRSRIWKFVQALRLPVICKVLIAAAVLLLVGGLSLIWTHVQREYWILSGIVMWGGWSFLVLGIWRAIEESERLGRTNDWRDATLEVHRVPRVQGGDRE